MKAIRSIFRLNFLNVLQYRVQAIAGMTTQFFFGFVFVMVYVAFYESGSTDKLPMPLDQLVSYWWLNQAFFSLVFMWTKEKDLISIIKNGNVAYELIRPINFYFKWYVTMLSKRIAKVLLRFSPVIIIAYFLPKPFNLNAPASLESFLLFLTSLILSAFLVIGISMIIHIITFFTLNEKGVMEIFMSTSEILAGGIVPLTLFPTFLYKIAYVLPFRYTCDLPFRIYTGNIPINEAIPDLVGSFIWIIVTIIIGYLLTRKALKKAVIQGG